jgi:hypothetical protein
VHLLRLLALSTADGWKNLGRKQVAPPLELHPDRLVPPPDVAWVGTDKGVSVTDGDTWVNYERRRERRGPHRKSTAQARPAEKRRPPTTALADGFVLGVYVDDHEAWLATSDGFSRGILSGKTNPKMASYQLSPNAPKPSTDSRRNTHHSPIDLCPSP